MEPPQYEPITTSGNLGDYSGGPFFGSFRGSGFRFVRVLRRMEKKLATLGEAPPVKDGFGV